MDHLVTKPANPVVTPDPGIPSDLLPPLIEIWLHATATLAGVPPVMVTIPFLAGTGGVIGNRLGLQLQPGWVEYPTLWIALVALTGTGKTPALLAARRPFDVLHTKLHADWQALSDESRSTQFAPLITTHAPWPQLQTLLPHTNGLILHRDELVGLIHAIDRRSGEDRQRYLSLWSGDVLHDTDHQIIPHPVVSIIGGIQPLLLHRIRSKFQDGLLERFLLVLAGAPTTHWPNNLPTSEPRITPIVDTLHTLRARDSTAIISFSPDAHALWVSWYNAQIDLTKSAPLVLGGFYRKLAIHLARLILILHALWNPDNPDQPVSRATMDRAITLIEYLRVQMHRSLVLISERHPHRSPADLLTDRILTILTNHTANDGWLGHQLLSDALFRPATSVFSNALTSLLNSGAIEQRPRPATGRGRRGQQYRSVKPS